MTQNKDAILSSCARMRDVLLDSKDGDTQTAHKQADVLLVRLCLLLAEESDEDILRAVVEAMNYYDEMDKWYA